MPVCGRQGKEYSHLCRIGARRFVDARTSDCVTVDMYDQSGSLHCCYYYFAVATSRLRWLVHAQDLSARAN
ncbi:hypothetical protein BHE97_19435 [Aeromicrobium sp. PE09-221]|nr:hypothetical protein BHE97_19435 [Aeromicrobium sp. PE09-221]